MPLNAVYRGPADLPGTIPVFPLPGALLLPRGQMPLNIFEPRYLAMVDDSLRDGHRLIGMIQPDTGRRTLFAPTHRRCSLSNRGRAEGRDCVSSVPSDLRAVRR
jgi:Lon protease-like protein